MLPWDAAQAAGGDGPTAGRAAYPPRSWPTKDQLNYTREAITVLLMVLALPWLVFKLITKPAAVLQGRGQAAVQKGP